MDEFVCNNKVSKEQDLANYEMGQLRMAYDCASDLQNILNKYKDEVFCLGFTFPSKEQEELIKEKKLRINTSTNEKLYSKLNETERKIFDSCCDIICKIIVTAVVEPKTTEKKPKKFNFWNLFKKN